MIILPGLLVILGVIALLTRWWSHKDEAARLATYRRVDPTSASNVTSARH